MTRIIEHPIRSEPINVWRAIDVTDGPLYITMFGIGQVFPIWFAGASEAEARRKAIEFRADVLARHEATFIARAEGVAKARDATAKRKAATEATT